MPPRTRTKASKEMKENVGVVKKRNLKSDGKVKKPPRKALADKTNSLSDDNVSIDVPVKTTKVPLKKAAKSVSVEEVRPRRDRRLPSRYIENQVLKNLSNSKDIPVNNHSSEQYQESQTKPKIRHDNVKQTSKAEEAKPQLSVEKFTSSRPKRNCRLQSVNAAPKDQETSNKSYTNSSSKNEEAKPQSSLEVFSSSRPKRNCRIQSVNEVPVPKGKETPNKSNADSSSPFKSPSQSFNSSLIANRPKRISRLPSRFEDHSISPNKFIPVQPCFASTPIAQKPKAITDNNQNEGKKLDKNQTRKIFTRKGKENLKANVKNISIEQYFSILSPTNKKMNILKLSPTNKRIQSGKNAIDKTSPDSNNNPKSKKTLLKRVVSTKSPMKKFSLKTKTKTGFAKRMLEKSLSFRVLEDRKERDEDKDIYEFTYDPKEEPTQKKKQKKPVRKRPPKPKTVVFKNNYDMNVAKALESLKSKVIKPALPQNAPTVPQNIPKVLQNAPTMPQNITKALPNAPTIPQNVQTQLQNVPTQPQNVPTVNKNPSGKINIIEDIIIKPASENTLNNTPAQPVNESAKNSVHISNYASINVDDIAADFESIGNEMNYSPAYSPPRPKTPEIKENVVVNHKDPLNLQGDMSFFNDHPVASSSMNLSIRDPLASPWRVEFGSLPIRWQANTYLKPNMTPAVDSSFVTTEETNIKKHVYTNMVCNDPFPEDPPVLKQPSIISFMRECAEKSMKKKRRRSLSLKKADSSSEDMSASNYGYKSPKKAKKEATNASNKSCDKENSNQDVLNQENNENSKENSNQSEKSPDIKTKNKDGTFFGFDETGSIDQENVFPKNVRRTRARGLRSKSRTVLQELNAPVGPTRAVLPVTKLQSSDKVNQIYDQIKSAEDAQIPEKEAISEKPVTNTEDPSLNDSDDSVHLFEDIELVHHLKPQRKSYGKAKKVTFRQGSNSDSSTSLVPEIRSSDEDDLEDLTFQMPNIKPKRVIKKKPKKQVSKKEDKEIEAWAAGFNSMCEDVDEFPLVVE